MWKALTGHFQPDPLATPENLAARDRVILHMVEVFSDAFFLWIRHRRDEKTARQHLVELLKNSADFAALIFKQPSSFEFRWDQATSARSGEERTLIVVPALVKVADEQGRRLEKQQIIMQPVVARI